MPGKKGKKLIPRKCACGKHRSVKQLVYEIFDKHGINVDRTLVEEIVMKEYPKSEFVHKSGKGGHFPWYKHKYQREKLETEFKLKDQGEEEEENHEQARIDARKKSRVG